MTWIYRQLLLQQPGQQVPPAQVPAMTALCDRLIAGWLPCWLAAWRESGLLERHFILRYSENGYHLRLRLLPTGDAEALTRELDARLLEFYAAEGQHIGVQPPADAAALYASGQVRAAEYEPELLKYGGPAGVELAERHFDVSSAIAAEIIQLELRPGIGRAQVALECLRAALRGFSPEEQALLLRSYASYWIASGPPEQQAQLNEQMEQHYQRTRQFLGQQAALAQHVAVAPLLERWALSVTESLTLLDAAERQGLLAVPASLPLAELMAVSQAARLAQTPLTHVVIAPNYLHLLLNRLGIPTIREVQLAYMLGRSIEEQAGLTGRIVPLQLEPWPVAASVAPAV